MAREERLGTSWFERQTLHYCIRKTVNRQRQYEGEYEENYWRICSWGFGVFLYGNAGVAIPPSHHGPQHTLKRITTNNYPHSSPSPSSLCLMQPSGRRTKMAPIFISPLLTGCPSFFLLSACSSSTLSRRHASLQTPTPTLATGSPGKRAWCSSWALRVWRGEWRAV
jgi:hypothetical protein